MKNLKELRTFCKLHNLNLMDIGEAKLSDVCVISNSPRDLHERLDNCDKTNRSNYFLSREDYETYKKLILKEKCLQNKKEKKNGTK